MKTNSNTFLLIFLLIIGSAISPKESFASGNAQFKITNDKTPVEKLIMEAIDSNHLILIRQGQKYFKMDRPLYDMFSRFLTGNVTEVDFNQLGVQKCLELKIKEETSIKRSNITLYLNEIISAEYIKTTAIKPRIQPEKNVVEVKDTIQTNVVLKNENEQKPIPEKILDPNANSTCDKITLKDGRIILATILEKDNAKVRYKTCLDSSNNEYERPLSSIEQLEYRLDGEVTIVKINNEEEVIKPESAGAVDVNIYSESGECADAIVTVDGTTIYANIQATNDSTVTYIACSDELQSYQEMYLSSVSELIRNHNRFPNPKHITTDEDKFEDILLLNSGQSVTVRILTINEEGVAYIKAGDILKRKFFKERKFISKIVFSDGFIQEYSENDVVSMNHISVESKKHISTNENSCGDKITLKSGLESEVRILYVNKEKVGYKKCSDPLHRTFVLDRKFVVCIKYEDGFVQSL